VVSDQRKRCVFDNEWALRDSNPRPAGCKPERAERCAHQVKSSLAGSENGKLIRSRGTHRGGFSAPKNILHGPGFLGDLGSGATPRAEAVPPVYPRVRVLPQTPGILARSGPIVGPCLMTSPETSRSGGGGWPRPNGNPGTASPPPGRL